MNGDDFDLEQFQPSFLEDGRGISDGQSNFPPYEQDDQDWDTNAWSRDENPDQDDITSGSGLEVACETFPDFAAGETAVFGVNKITFNRAVFKIHDNGGGEVQISCA